MFVELFLWALVIGSWFTLLLLKKEDIKRYMPAALLASYLMIIYNIFASNRSHWEIHYPIIPALDPLFISGVFGVFPVITIWVFYFTYRRVFGCT
ncbi:hypothetical protein [Halalkalibacter hemicellulosilyticus]|uniref:Uncharacterized protein n=1 Tax=Halalkalibacter hemicellulosilyticusJCM 9152 TaxID=1236971 RepID=W4QE96_9BACI|nr:hypothetical protein [Halalkalibacter hemicellulosilyticus]GAE30385.1 hypothetical protein JCM9152_1791 [Halalkalibacter hemicellulosilyticusJCM 9152]